MPEVPNVESIARALEKAGIVIPVSLNLPSRIATELRKEGIDLGPDWGGLALTHCILVWRF